MKSYSNLTYRMLRNTRLLQEVGWTQTFELEPGLQDTIDWWRAQAGVGQR